METNRKLHAACAASIALVVGAASAQSFNIEVDGAPPASGAGIPANTFAGAANQPGTWNGLTSTGPLTLVGLNGSATAVTLSGSSYVIYSFPNAQTTGDFDLLLDDVQDCGFAGPADRTYTFSNLAAGTYEVYTYGWAPDAPGQLWTDISVTGSTSTNPQTVGTSAAVPSTSVPFETPGHYALHVITVPAAGSITINAAPGTGSPGGAFGSVNGIQLKLLGGKPCLGDTNNSGVVDVDDLVAVILGWGACAGCPPTDCASDIDNDCDTDVDDLVAVILAWGPC
jgi:hypothetical protein